MQDFGREHNLLLFSARQLGNLLRESSDPQFVPFTHWVTLGKVTHPICCTRVTYLKQCDICTEIKPKSLLTIHPYQKPSHNSPEMQTLLCRDQARKKPGWQNSEPQQHIRTWRERSYNSQSSYLLHIWQKPSLKQTNKQTTLWRDSYSCGNTHPGTDRIQTRRGRGKSGVIPGLALACQERSRPSQVLIRQSQDTEEVVLVGECLSLWLTRQGHIMMLW